MGEVGEEGDPAASWGQGRAAYLRMSSMAMSWAALESLRYNIQRKQFSLRQAKFYASEVLLALEYFHANGIIYR